MIGECVGLRDREKCSSGWTCGLESETRDRSTMLKWVAVDKPREFRRRIVVRRERNKKSTFSHALFSG